MFALGQFSARQLVSSLVCGDLLQLNTNKCFIIIPTPQTLILGLPTDKKNGLAYSGAWNSNFICRFLQVKIFTTWRIRINVLISADHITKNTGTVPGEMPATPSPIFKVAVLKECFCCWDLDVEKNTRIVFWIPVKCHEKGTAGEISNTNWTWLLKVNKKW